LTLNDAQVKAEKPGSNRRRISDGGGLLLEIDPAGGKYWLWRHRYPPTKDGKQQDYRIGIYPNVSLKKARQIRDEQKSRMLTDGINPCRAKKQEKMERFAAHHALTTFETVALDWHKNKAQGTWSKRHTKRTGGIQEPQAKSTTVGHLRRFWVLPQISRTCTSDS